MKEPSTEEAVLSSVALDGMDRALESLSQSSFSAAAEHLRNVLASDPQFIPALLGVVMLLEWRPSLALEEDEVVFGLQTAQFAPPQAQQMACEYFNQKGDADEVFWYLRGVWLRDVREEPETATKEFRRAASGGFAPALLALGKFYQSGSDPATAAQFFEQAADCRHALAEFELGQAVEQGHGIPQDLRAAKRWYSAAGRKGLELAKVASDRMTLEQDAMEAAARHQKDQERRELMESAPAPSSTHVTSHGGLGREARFLPPADLACHASALPECVGGFMQQLIVQPNTSSCCCFGNSAKMRNFCIVDSEFLSVYDPEQASTLDDSYRVQGPPLTSFSIRGMNVLDLDGSTGFVINKVTRLHSLSTSLTSNRLIQQIQTPPRFLRGERRSEMCG